jgi:C1A family cysteine protease
MIRAVVLVAAALSPLSLFAQGAIIETPDQVKNIPDAPASREMLPQRAEVTNMPPPRDQADASSCVSWAVTYAAASQASRRNGLGAGVMLAPSFTYNQVSGDRTCLSGTSIVKTLDLLRDKGTLPIEEFAYDPGWCGRMPTEAEKTRALRYRIKGYSKLDAGDIEAVKAQLARGLPVIFSMRVGPKMRGHRGDSVFTADFGDLGGHTMVAIGYDEARKAFRIQNSWGRNWADGGYGWFAYDFWKRNVRFGYVID